MKQLPRRLFAGSDYNQLFDCERLTKQIDRIFHHMKDEQFRTLGEIKIQLEEKYPGVHFPEASISAQLRNLRKTSGGCHQVEKQRRGCRENGLFEYRIKIEPDLFKVAS